MHLYRTKNLTLAAVLALGLLGVRAAARNPTAEARVPDSTYQEASRDRDYNHRQDDGDRRDGEYRRSRAYHKAFDRGYKTGLDRGKDDGRSRRNEDPDNSQHYRDADSGYHSGDGPIEAYRLGYRDGFRRGYAQNYRRYYRR